MSLRYKYNMNFLILMCTTIMPSAVPFIPPKTKRTKPMEIHIFNYVYMYYSFFFFSNVQQQQKKNNIFKLLVKVTVFFNISNTVNQMQMN